MSSLKEKLSNLSITQDFGDPIWTRLNQHFALLSEWNQRMNLVSRKSMERAWSIHYADSILISTFASKWVPGKIAYDLGTGAGFPGVVFAILYPHLQTYIVERSEKKRRFLKEVLTTLSLQNLTLLDELQNPQRPALVLARAVMPIPELLPYIGDRFGKGDVLIVNHGSEVTVPDGRWRVMGTEVYELPENEGARGISAVGF